MTGWSGDEVLFEFNRIGNFMKVVAIDPNSGTEVAVVGPANNSLELLKRTAVNKLHFVMKRDAARKGAAG